jgi:hypothetical protein
MAKHDEVRIEMLQSVEIGLGNATTFSATRELYATPAGGIVELKLRKADVGCIVHSGKGTHAYIFGKEVSQEEIARLVQKTRGNHVMQGNLEWMTENGHDSAVLLHNRDLASKEGIRQRAPYKEMEYVPVNISARDVRITLA